MEVRRIIQIVGDVNCLFRAASYYLYKTEKLYCGIRSQIAGTITNYWIIAKSSLLAITLVVSPLALLRLIDCDRCYSLFSGNIDCGRYRTLLNEEGDHWVASGNL